MCTRHRALMTLSQTSGCMPLLGLWLRLLGTDLARMSMTGLATRQVHHRLTKHSAKLPVPHHFSAMTQIRRLFVNKHFLPQLEVHHC